MPLPRASHRAWRLALALVLLFAPAAGARAQRGGLAVQGTVVDSTAGAALGGVALELTGAAVRAVTQTDGAGRFRFVGIRPGTYTLTIRRIGYVARAPERLELARDTVLAVALSRVAREIATVLVRDSTTGIQGVVGTAAGMEPIPSARVQVAGVRGTFTSDSAGRFFIPIEKAGTYALRISREGYHQSLRTVEVANRRMTDGSALLDSAPPRASAILGANWEDLDQRQRWRTMNSALVSGFDLVGKGGTLTDALQMTPSFVSRGLRIGPSTCVFVDGVPRPGMPIDAIAPEQIEMIEVYGSGGEASGNLIKRWPSRVDCADGSRSAPVMGQTSMLGNSSRGFVRYAVIWLKRR